MKKNAALEKANILTKVEACKASIAKERDILRDLLADLEDLCDSCDEAVLSLESAVDKLSEHL